MQQCLCIASWPSDSVYLVCKQGSHPSSRRKIAYCLSHKHGVPGRSISSCRDPLSGAITPCSATSPNSADPPAVPFYPFFGGGFPTKIEYRPKVGTPKPHPCSRGTRRTRTCEPACHLLRLNDHLLCAGAAWQRLAPSERASSERNPKSALRAMRGLDLRSGESSTGAIQSKELIHFTVALETIEHRC